jgi:putative ABC transport system substrate-binding protein
MISSLQRREFITLLGGAAAAWPLAARAQQSTMPVIGFLHIGSREPFADRLAGFHKGLSETGFVEGRNVAIEYRWANDDDGRVPDLVADLVRRRVAVIVSTGSAAVALALKAATTTIPIVFTNGALDPVQTGLVASFNRPGGNVTGVTSISGELMPKQLGLLHELLPGAARFAVLFVTPTSLIADKQVASLIADMQAAAATIGGQIEVLTAGNNREIDTAFLSLVPKRVDALLVGPGVLFSDRRVQLATLAAHHRVPAIYSRREHPEAGGLMSYGASLTDRLRQTGIYTGRILKGEKPADLPVMRPTKFQFVINLQTARTLGIEVPPTLLALADEVIE